MDNKENKDLNYDFGFENQVTKKDEKVPDATDEVEVLDDSTDSTDVKIENNNTETNDIEKLEENVEELTDDNLDETKNSETNVKKIKILNKEFNYEDVILVLMGIVIVVAIFLMPKIMSMFK